MTQSTEQERAEFEALFKSDENLQVFLDQNDISEEDAPLYFAAAFFGWQAARRAQVVPDGLAKQHLIGDVQQPAIRYDLLSAYADKHRLHFNGLCNLVREAVAAAPQPPEAGLMSEKRTTKPEAAPVQMPEPVETVRYWRDAYANPKGDEHFIGHGMVVKIFEDYLELLAAHGVK